MGVGCGCGVGGGAGCVGVDGVGAAGTDGAGRDGAFAGGPDPPWLPATIGAVPAGLLIARPVRFGTAGNRPSPLTITCEGDRRAIAIGTPGITGSARAAPPSPLTAVAPAPTAGGPAKI